LFFKPKEQSFASVCGAIAHLHLSCKAGDANKAGGTSTFEAIEYVVVLIDAVFPITI
jgi:hypothetical protein